MSFPTNSDELVALYDERNAELASAKKAKNKDKIALLEKEIALIEDTIFELALEELARHVGILNTLRAKLDALRAEISDWPFGTDPAPEDQETSPRAEEETEVVVPPVPDAPVGGEQPAGTAKWEEDYTGHWKSMVVAAPWEKQAKAICKRIVASQSRYEKAVKGTHIPWWFVAVVHSMEANLRFSTHLHNGDPLSARTVQVPSGRPAHGNPPFSWEVSARDALEHDGMTAVSDWSLEKVLHRWHRYNGIKNAYQRNEIPTPYLWSGCQHYRKGKYVADGKFKPEAVSKQVGAAILLRVLVDLGVVALSVSGKKLEENINAVAGSVALLKLDLDHAGLKNAASELKYSGLMKKGSGGSGSTATQKKAVKRVQEWLILNRCHTSIDGDFGEATLAQVKRFQALQNRDPSGIVDEKTWILLTMAMRRALAPPENMTGTSFEENMVRVAKTHIDQTPVEIGGPNRGPWVRLYMNGKEGAAQKWCAGFVCLIVAQAARDMGLSLPFSRHVGVDELVHDAVDTGRFIRGTSLGSIVERRSKLKPGQLFVRRRNASDWTHVGIILKLNETMFDTLEGNTGGNSGIDGANAWQGTLSYDKKDFLQIF